MVLASRRPLSLLSIVIFALAAGGGSGCKKDGAKDAADAAADAEAATAATADAAVAAADAGADAAVVAADGTDAAAPAVATAAVGKPKLVDPPICVHARVARARNSPAAPGLEAQCKAQGGKL